MKIPKMVKIVYRQMPTPRELPQQIPPPPGKSWNARAPGWEPIFGAKSEVCGGGGDGYR